jgi:RTX calcium-binding nonapeptide repeat (4 copies)
MSIRIFSGSLYVGDQQNDFLSLTAKQLAKARVELGAGLDTLAITASGSYAFGPSSYARLKGVDILDFSRMPDAYLSLTISNAMVAQSDYQQLTLVSGGNGIDSLNTGGVTSGIVTIAGSGDVTLANGVSNHVTIANGALVNVLGGNGDDTIQAAASGSTLDGGGGNDNLVAGSGIDTILHQAGDGADVVSGFNAVSDRINLAGQAFATLNDFLDATTDTASGALVSLGNGDSLLFSGVSEEALATAFITSNGQQLVHVPPTIMIGTSMSAAELNALIAGAEAGTTFVLANGVHRFDEALLVDRGDITIKGQSETATILNFSFAPGAQADAIQVTGGPKTYIGLAQQQIQAGQDAITLSQGHALQPGDTVYLYQPNTPEYLAANGWTNVSWAEADQRPFREFIVEISSVEGNVIHLTHPLPYDMDLGEARVFSIEMLHGVTLSDFSLTYDLGISNPYDFFNTLPEYDGLSAIQLTSVSGAHLDNISILEAASNGISLTSCIGVTGNNLYVDGALNKGSDGNGYSLLLSEAFNNSFTGLDLYDGRHSVIFSAWNAETGNLIDVSETNRDINFHGSPDTGNVIVVGHAVLDYSPAPGASVWSIVSHGGTNHASTDIYAGNTVSFNFAVGSSANDEIMGTSGNDYLNAVFGYDTINGGTGDDYLVGGTRRDVMTGGTGADTFLLRMGDDLDRITDFTFGTGGDSLIFSGNAAVTSMANLTFTQNGADLYVRYGSNSTVILTGHTLADVDTTNFIFDSAGQQTLDAYNGTFVL